MRNVGEQMAAKRSLFVCSKQVLIEEVERKQKKILSCILTLMKEILVYNLRQ